MIQTTERRVRMIPAAQQTATGTTQTKKLRVAAYCRVSTDSDEQLTSYEAQKSYYTEKIQANPDWEMAGIYADEGISGTGLKKRKEFNRMIAACKRGRINLILTKSLSRFARNTVDCLDTVRTLKANGIGVIFEKENINTLTESSEFLITLFSGFAQAESESLSQNVLWGKRKRMESGEFTFPKLLGYQKNDDGTIEIIPEEAETVRYIYRRYLEGASIATLKTELIATEQLTKKGTLNWGHQAIQNILANEKYIGDALLQKTFTQDPISKKVIKNQGERPMYYVENHHTAIVPRDIYARVQEELARRNSKRKTMENTTTEQGKYSSKYALSELLVCGECGSPYRRVTWSRNGTKRIVWRCTSRLENGTKFCQHSPTMEEEKLHSLIMEQLHDFANTQQEVLPTLLDHITQVVSGQGDDGSEQLKDRLLEITNRQAILLEMVLEDMDNPDLSAQMQALAEEKKVLQTQLDSLAPKRPTQPSVESRVAQIAHWVQFLQPETQYSNDLIRQAIQQITVQDGETVGIKFKGGT
ncbi:recombinase family protein [Bengtsoniella intestinalis]|uniref:recombinase family protein n=1 Tax=Bengtsoniella intestinalis TaxID=3073143 RepID=UPI00391F487A